MTPPRISVVIEAMNITEININSTNSSDCASSHSSQEQYGQQIDLTLLVLFFFFSASCIMLSLISCIKAHRLEESNANNSASSTTGAGHHPLSPDHIATKEERQRWIDHVEKTLTSRVWNSSGKVDLDILSGYYSTDFKAEAAGMTGNPTKDRCDSSGTDSTAPHLLHDSEDSDECYVIQSLDSFDEDIGCAICMLNFVDGDVVCESSNLTCKHVYHRACMLAWLRKHDNCPMCREKYLLETV
jgi:hypothetical protein